MGSNPTLRTKIFQTFLRQNAVPLLERFVPPQTSKALNRNFTSALSMVNKRLIMVACVVFAVGIIVGSLAFRSDLSSNVHQTYPVDAKIVQAYFKEFNTSSDSGVGYKTLLSYIFVINLTNPSETTLRLSNIRIDEAGNTFSYQRDFPKSNAYWIEPHTSKLVAFSQTEGLDSFHAQPFNFSSFQLPVTLVANVVPTEGNGNGGVVTSITMTLQKISADEFIYGTTFNNSSNFIFNSGNHIEAWDISGQWS